MYLLRENIPLVKKETWKTLFSVDLEEVVDEQENVTVRGLLGPPAQSTELTESWGGVTAITQGPASGSQMRYFQFE